MRNTRAFTLIELLVVITIIVVLLALLTPALEKALYQAQLAVCAANLRSVGWLAMGYTQDNRKYFPDRKIQGGPLCSINQIGDVNDQGVTNPLSVDDRPSMRTSFPLNKVFNDPFCQKIDIDQSLSTSQLELSYNLWWSFKWYSHPNERRLTRLYDRFTYTKGSSSGPIQYSFNVLASDLESMGSFGSGTAFSAHPDRDGVMANLRTQDENEAGGGATDTKYTYSKWTNRGTGQSRPPTDYNYVKGDMSVASYDRVTWDEESKQGRLVWVPWWRNDVTHGNVISHLPRD